MRRWAQVVLVLLSIVAMIASAQDRGLTQETQARGYWTDSSTSLMWAGKDNGKDVNWHSATKYCRDLRLDGYSDWRLANIGELQGIFDKSAEAPGLAGKYDDEPFTFHVKGNLFLTGDPWSSTQRTDDRGHPNGLAWYFDFINGRRNNEDAGRFTGYNANYGRRALCVRGSGK